MLLPDMPCMKSMESRTLSESLPLDPSHACLVFRTWECKLLDPVLSHQPCKGRSRRYQIHHWKAGLKDFEILIHVLVLLEISKGLAEHERGDGVQSEVGGRGCKVQSLTIGVFAINQVD